jgi:dTDP-4-dehydrorhamnose reductase
MESVLITGASGLLGRSILEEFQQEYKVIATGYSRVKPDWIQVS